MNITDLTQHIDGAKEALQSFLATLLGEDVLLQTEAPEAVTFVNSGLLMMDALIVLSPSESDSGFAVQLDPPWLPLLSKAMLGEPMELSDDGADDLVRELAGQGYGSIRNHLAGDDVKLPDATFEVLTHGSQLTAGVLPDDLLRVAFSTQVGGTALNGTAFLPAAEEAASAAAFAAMPAPAPAIMQPGLSGAPVAVGPASFPNLSGSVMGGDGDNFGLLAEVELEVTVELGRRRLSLSDVLRLTTGSVIELENLVGEPLEVYANGRLIAEGEAVVIDEQFGIRITRLASDRQRTRAFL